MGVYFNPSNGSFTPRVAIHLEYICDDLQYID